MAVIGAHVLLHTSEPEAVRAVFRDVFGWPHVDDGDGWLIFRLPPAELGVHPTDPSAPGGTGARHELSLMVDDIAVTVAELRERGVEVPGDPVDQGWGIAATAVLPGGLEVQLYEPRHSTAVDT